MNRQMNEFIAYLQEVKQVSNNTSTSYQQDLHKFLAFLKEHQITKLSKVTETNIYSYILELEKNNRSAATIARTIVSIKGFFSYLMKYRKISIDPSERIKPPKVEKKLPQALSTLQVQSLLESPDLSTPKGLRDKAMFEIMYATGMKASELIELQMDDIDFTHGILICRGTKRDRVIPFGEKANYAVKEYLDNGRERFAGLQTHSYVFVNQHGKPMTRQGFWKILKEYAALLEINELSPQLLRHSFAMHLIENGANVNVVGEMLGYTDRSLAYVYTDSKNVRVMEEYNKAHPRV